MKEDTHPDNFRKVIFHDTTSGEEFLFASTVETDETGEYEGEEYPLTRIEMSSASHPFYTGVEKVVDTAGRVEKFEARAQKAQESDEDSSDGSEEDSADADQDQEDQDPDVQEESEEDSDSDN
jgi:large subunit ribosomal protein L31